MLRSELGRALQGAELLEGRGGRGNRDEDRVDDVVDDAGVVIVLVTTQVVAGVLLARVVLGQRRHAGRTLAPAILAVGAAAAITG